MVRTSKIRIAGVAAVVAFVSLAAMLASGQGPKLYVPQWQTDAGGTAKFDVVSIKPITSSQAQQPRYANVPLDGRDLFVPTGGLFSVANDGVGSFIIFAYKLQSYQSFLADSNLPKWAYTVHYAVQARASGNPTKDQFRLMMQALLAERFKLVVHWETHQVPVFALALEKPGRLGPQLRVHSDEPPCPEVPVLFGSPGKVAGGFPEACGTLIPWLESGRDYVGGRNMTISLIASESNGTMVDTFDRPVVDKTGLTGKYDFVMSFTPQPVGPQGSVQPDSTGQTWIEALRYQLGLKLESTMGSVDILVIDHIEEPSPN